MRGIWNYQELLPPIAAPYQVTLGEGNTPLLRSKNIGKALGIKNLFFKLENLNPTGSYKDRFAALAIANTLQEGNQVILATSSGNTGAALAAYSSCSGIKCIVCLVDGAPFGKVQQMGVYGAELLMIKDFGVNDKCTKDVMEYLRELSHTERCSLEISAYRFSPIGMQGVQTIAFEIAEKLPEVNHVFVPAGGGGLFLSVLMGFKKWKDQRDGSVSPHLHCVQPAGNDTIASVLNGSRSDFHDLEQSLTKISGLQVPTLLDASEIYEQSLDYPCNGVIVEDEEVFSFQKKLAQQEGIYCEPAGAVALVGLKNAIESGEIKPDEQVVCLITGNGFKDQNALNKVYTKEDCLYTQDLEETRIEIENKILN